MYNTCLARTPIEVQVRVRSPGCRSLEYVHLVVLWVSIRSLVLSYLYGCCSLAEERLYDHSEVIFCVVASGQYHAVHLLAVLFRDVKQLLLFFSVLWKGGTFTEETGKQTILICQTMPLSFKEVVCPSRKKRKSTGRGDVGVKCLTCSYRNQLTVLPNICI